LCTARCRDGNFFVSNITCKRLFWPFATSQHGGGVCCASHHSLFIYSLSLSVILKTTLSENGNSLKRTECVGLYCNMSTRRSLSHINATNFITRRLTERRPRFYKARYQPTALPVYMQNKNTQLHEHRNLNLSVPQTSGRCYCMPNEVHADTVESEAIETEQCIFIISISRSSYHVALTLRIRKRKTLRKYNADTCVAVLARAWFCIEMQQKSRNELD